MIVTQLVERSLLIPEICGSNPVIGKFYITYNITVNCIDKTKIKKKRPRMAHFLKNNNKLCLDTLGSDCDAVGRAVASDSRDLRFESSHQQILYYLLYYCQLYWKDENKEKVAGNGPLKNQLCLQVDAWSDNLPGDWCSIPRLACYCALSCLLSNWTHKVLLIHWKLRLNPNWQFYCSSLWDKFTNDYWQPTVNCSMVNVDLVTWPGACFIKCFIPNLRLEHLFVISA